MKIIHIAVCVFLLLHISIGEIITTTNVNEEFTTIEGMNSTTTVSPELRTELDLSNNHLNQDTLGSLGIYTQLLVLILDKNQFTNFPNLTDVALTLDKLYLRYNPMTAFDVSEIQQMPVLPSKLRVLDLTGCQFTVFPNVTFLTQSLEIIVLVDNNINSVPGSHILGVPLARIYLTDNDLTSWPVGLHVLINSLEVLDVSGNPFTEITMGDNTAPFNSLKVIFLNGNSLVSFPSLASVFGNKLVEINMVYSKASRPAMPFPDHILNDSFPDLKRLTITNMKMLTLPDLSCCPNLTLFNYKDNNVKNVSRSLFSNLPLLTGLSLSVKIVDKCPRFGNEFGDILEYLTITADSPIDSLPLTSLTGNFKVLTYLRLKGIGLEVMPTFSNMAKLEELDLTINPIKAIPCTAFDGMVSLRKLLLTETDVITLHDVTVGSPLLTALSLPDASLSCDCTLYWLKTLAHTQVLYDSSIVCGPGDFAGEFLVNTTIQACRPGYQITPETYGTVNRCDYRRSTVLMQHDVTSREDCALLCLQDNRCNRFEVEYGNQPPDGSDVTCRCIMDPCQASVTKSLKDMYLMKITKFQ